MRKTGYVVFCEDKFYLLWQLEVFLHSLTNRAKISEKDIIVLYADPNYFDPNTEWSISPYLEGIFNSYPEIQHHSVQNWGRKNWYYRFQDNGTWHPKQYAGINKWLSLCEAANAGWLDSFQEILLLEQDLWFSESLPSLPKGNCVTANWLCDRERAFGVDDKTDKENTEGFNLNDIMNLCKVPQKNQNLWTSGAIIFKFITTQLKKSEFLNAIANYHQLLMTLSELALPQGARHETDMVAPSLAMAHCGMKCKTIDDIAWKSDVWTYHEELPKNGLVHYGWDFSHHPHLKSSFAKAAFNHTTPWEDDTFLRLEYHDLPFQWLKDFYDDLLVLRFNDIDRACFKSHSHPVI